MFLETSHFRPGCRFDIQPERSAIQATQPNGHRGIADRATVNRTVIASLHCRSRNRRHASGLRLNRSQTKYFTIGSQGVFSLDGSDHLNRTCLVRILAACWNHAIVGRLSAR